MKRNKILYILLSFALILACICNIPQNKYSEIKLLWKDTISKYIEEDLWDEINCYDAGHTLLVPMYYAFQLNDTNKKSEFEQLFKRFANYLKENEYNYDYWDINHMQFLFLASNYINLNSNSYFILFNMINYLNHHQNYN